jgi:hypothetical protein
MVWHVALREVSQSVAPTDVPVVLGDVNGRLAAIDLRDDLTLVEYTRVDDSRWSMLAVLVVLNVLDVVSTAAVISAGGTENNPLMRPLVEGIWPAVVIKTAVLLTIAWLLGRSADSRRIGVMMACTTGWYIAVVCWNLTILGFG